MKVPCINYILCHSIVESTHEPVCEKCTDAHVRDVALFTTEEECAICMTMKPHSVLNNPCSHYICMECFSRMAYGNPFKPASAPDTLNESVLERWLECHKQAQAHSEQQFTDERKWLSVCPQCRIPLDPIKTSSAKKYHDFITSPRYRHTFYTLTRHVCEMA